MATNHTEHYELSQWVRTDSVLMSDFNEDNAKIDAALHDVLDTIPKVVAGSYTGTGEGGVVHYSLGFKPKLLFLITDNAYGGNTYDVFFIAMDGFALNFTSASNFSVYRNNVITLDDDGFNITHSTSQPHLGYNREGVVQHYWALK